MDETPVSFPSYSYNVLHFEQEPPVAVSRLMRLADSRPSGWPVNLALLAAAGLLVCAAAARAQEVPPDAPPAPVSGPDTPAPIDGPLPSAPPARVQEGAAPALSSPAPSTSARPAPQEEPLPAYLRHLAAVGAAWGPAPSPDGARIAFVTTLFGSRQAAVIPSGGGYPVQLTDEPGGVVAVRFAPRDAHLLFTVVLRAGQRRVLLIDDAGGVPRELDSSPGEQLMGGFTRDGRRLLYALVDGERIALKWLTIDSRQIIEVAAPLPQAGSPPTPAGQKPLPPAEPLSKSLAGLSALAAPTLDARFTVAQLRRGADENLVRVDLNSTRVELLTPHQGNARFRTARFSPDGKLVYVLTDEGRNALGVDSIAVSSKARKTLYAPAGEVESYSLADDGHRLVAAQVSGGETLFTLLELPSLRQQPLPQPPPGALQPSVQGEPSIVWSRNGERLFFAWGQADQTTDLYVLRADFGSAVRLTHSPRPGLPEGSLPRPRTLEYASADGKQIPALLWMPKPAPSSGDGRQPAPPHAAVVLTGGQARPLFDARIAALAGINIASLEPGVRGSEGRGKAHAAEDAEGAVGDVVSAARFLQKSSEVDGAAPLLVGIGAGADRAIQAAQRDPAAFSGLVLVADRAPAPPPGLKLPVLALSAHGASALAELVAFARAHLERSKSTAAR